MTRLAVWLAAGLLLVGCGDDDTTGAGGAGGTTSSSSGGSGGTSTGTTSATGGGGSGASGGTGGEAGAGGSTVGSPELFTESLFEMDFSAGTSGQYRANGGTWEDFDSWSQPGVAGGWDNADAVWVQTTDAVRTELLDNGLGDGRVLRTWIEAGDEWTSSATYPRTELTSGFTSDLTFGGEYRLEMQFYAEGDVASSGGSIIGFQLHHDGNTGSPPLGLFLSDGELQFLIEEESSGSNWTDFDLIPLVADSLIQLVLEVKFGHASDGAYVRMWVNGTQYVEVTDLDVGYPDVESTAGYWKFCSLYDWGNDVQGSRSVYCGPGFKLLQRP